MAQHRRAQLMTPAKASSISDWTPASVLPRGGELTGRNRLASSTQAKELPMKAKVVEDADVVTYVAVCDPGDEAVSALTQFARSEHLEAAQITAVGAFERAIVGWFDPAARDYRRIPVDEQCEVLSLIGDVAEGQDGPILHLHAVLGLSDGTTRGGHLLEGRVFPTLEVVVTESPARLRKVLRPDIGIALIDLERSES